MTSLVQPVSLLALPASGWSVRLGRGAAGRPALEVYAGPRLADVSVATPLSVALVRGALRNRRRDVPWALAWGQLPHGEPAVEVEFTGRSGRRHVHAHIVGGAYWVAETAGEFSDVTVRAGATRECIRLRRSRRG